ncbi:MAG: DUF1345 domain-containing protein [Alphaproteobacteria bacterium]|nr:DUF1345 domain-containing protein [Alphaproteobacteria bacterium]MBU1512590.1 DUF1345 domain-containing protein [Alphaproteobacteria bacterium]MBU2092929.1 DUF1345 domain-containing protein [Alphaproteobacteria bacterium]MBU2150832.1 DUF1345 domain-containing protein [Alphaproteobacteria bacterium]MBU2307956.1 DUF1345 domain-containing protein [Alphaproteobacteria bacterium]
MTRTPAKARSGHWRLGPKTFMARPRLSLAMGAGLVVGAACALLAPDFSPSSSAIAGWDAFCALYAGLTFTAIAREGPNEIRARAAQQDEGQAVILCLVLAACIVSLAVVGLELSQAQHDHGLQKGVRVATAFVTLTGSWLVMQMVFALHYAHEYYAADPKTKKDTGGLLFPGGEAPDYWDFLHFSIVIGVASQTADIAFTAKPLRRLGTAHSLIAFAFNTLILALTINLVAGLFAGN